MNLELTLEQTDCMQELATIRGITAEQAVLDLINQQVANKRANAAIQLQRAADQLSYEKRLELITLNRDFIAANQ